MKSLIAKLMKFIPMFAAALAGAATVWAYSAGATSTIVQAALTDASGKKVYASRQEHEETQKKLAALDAGTAKKEDIQELKQAIKELDTKYDKKSDEQTKLIIRAIQKGK